MSAAKRLKLETAQEEQKTGSSSSEAENDDDFSLEPVGSEEISIDLVGFPPSDVDFDGIHQFLQQLFSDDCIINLERLTETLIDQNYIGSVLKLEDDDSSEQNDGEEEPGNVFAVLSCYSLSRPKNYLRDSIVTHLLNKCNSSSAKPATKDVFKKVLSDCVQEKSPKPVGLLISERFINCPAQCVLPMFNALLEEITEANIDGHQTRYDFNHYLMICKACHINAKNSLQTLYANPEEELFAEQAKASFSYTVNSNTEMTRRCVLLLNEDGLKTAIDRMSASFGA